MDTEPSQTSKVGRFAKIVNPLVPDVLLKGHTYLNKPAAESFKYA